MPTGKTQETEEELEREFEEATRLHQVNSAICGRLSRESIQQLHRMWDALERLVKR